MRTTLLRHHLPIARPALAACALLTSSAVGAAQDDAWRFTLTPYVWATDVGLDVELAGRQVVDTTIPVADLMEDLDWSLQGRFEAKKGAHGVLLDVFYVSMSDEVDDVTLPQGAGSGDLDWQLDMTVASVAGIYDPKGDDKGFSFLYGLRILDQRATVDASFDTSTGSTAQSYGGSDTLVDALVGIRFRAELTSHLSIQTQVDVSSGGTELTWSGAPTVSYAFGDGDWAVHAGYRHMQIDFEEEGDLEADMSLSGPVLGLSASF